MSTIRLAARNRIPYGGMYYVTDKLTGIPVKGMNFESVYRAVVTERNANGAPVGLGLEDEVEQWICEAYPQECQLADTLNVPKRSWGMMDIVRGTIVFAKRQITGESLVTQEEANRRAQICSTCKPYATEFHKPCAGLCSELVQLLSGIGNRATPHDNSVRSCSICGCWTKVAVWFPVDLQWSVLSDTQKAQFQSVPWCWKKPSESKP